MKSKKLIWILLPTVLGIWGLVGYNIYIQMNPDVLSVNSEKLEITKPDALTEVDTIRLMLDYPDPFMKKIKQSRKPDPVMVSKVKKKPTKKPVDRKKDVIQAPTLVWSGRVKNTESNKETFLVMANGRSHIVSVGDSVAGFKFNRAFADSLEFKSRNHIIYAKR